MSTALTRASLDDEQGSGLDLSGYDPQAYNILSPVLRLDTAAPYLRLRAVEVRLDPDITRGDCYAAPGAKWTRERGVSVPTLVAPSKPGLLKIASAAGLVIDPVNSHRIKPDACERCIDMARSTGQSVRCGDCASRYDVAYQHIGAVRTDTGWRIVKASYEWNLDAQRRKLVREAKKRLAKGREGVAPSELELDEYVEDRLDQIIAERFGLAETKSLLRLVRAICHLRQAYTREEMGRPFVVVRAELAPDYADPEVRRALAERALASGAEIFGPAREALVAAPAPVEPEVIEELSSVPDFTEAEERAEEAAEAVVEEAEVEQEEPETLHANDPAAEEQPEPIAEPPVPDQSEPESAAPATPDQAEPTDPEPPAARCDDCGAGLTQAVVAYCQSARGQATFGGASYCYACQKKHRPARARKAVAQ